MNDTLGRINARDLIEIDPNHYFSELLEDTVASKVSELVYQRELVAR
jgi:hypothetical protein